MDEVKQTAEEALKELCELFPDIDGLQVTENAWFWKEQGYIQHGAKILLGVGYDAPKFSSEGKEPLAECMFHARAYKRRLDKETSNGKTL